MRCCSGVSFRVARTAMDLWMLIGTSSRECAVLSTSMAARIYEELAVEEQVVVKAVVKVLVEEEEGGKGGGFVLKEEKTGFNANRPWGRCAGRVGSPSEVRCRRLPELKISNDNSTMKKLRPETSTVGIAGRSRGERPPTVLKFREWR